MSFSKLVLIALVLVFGLNFEAIECDSIIKRASYGVKWPSRTIPISFKSTSQIYRLSELDQAHVTSALRLLEATRSVDGEKCIKFVPKTIEKD
jgi:hypothetical protein